MKALLIYLIIVMLNYTVLAKNDFYIISIQNNENDKNYDEAPMLVQNAMDELINERMNDIYNMIIDNKDTYILDNGEIDEKLNEISGNMIKKRNSNKVLFKFINKNRPKNIDKRSFDTDIEYIPIESKIVYHICPILNYYAIRAYLSEAIVEKVKNLPYVISCRKDTKLKEINFKRDEYNTIDELNKHYDLNYIKKETKWSNVSVQLNLPTHNYFSHLSLISQYNYNSDLIGYYDNNYYYPASAGKGINIYFIDRGIDISNTNDYNMYKGTSDERTITCDVIITNSIQKQTSNDSKNKYCSINSEYPRHGIMVSAVAGGSQIGVAKKSNLHMIATDVYISDELVAFDYIKMHGKPYKSIVSVSRQGWEPYNKNIQDKINELTNEGYIIIVGAGNDKENVCVKTNGLVSAYAGYENVIVVGATENTIDENITNGYKVSGYSNYGKCVDIHAPGEALYSSAEYYGSSNILYYKESGTSCAVPIVAGVAAMIMAENPNTKYNVKLMKQTLIDMSLKNILTGLRSSDTPNRFINNGKHIVYSLNRKYYGCGILSGNSKCSKGCCSKDGKCISSSNSSLCQIDNGCQSSFGQCVTRTTTTTKKSTTTTKKTTTTTKKTTTTTIKKTSTTVKPTNMSYISVKFKGTMQSSKFYLGVDSLTTFESFDIYKLNSSNSAVYRTWHITSKIEPSYLYLSKATYGNNGEPSQYCLDLGPYKSSEGYNFLSVVKCSEAKHKFLYGGSHSKTIDIYNLNNVHITDSNNNKLCLYYSMTPRISRCDYITDSSNKNYEHMKWDIYYL